MKNIVICLPSDYYKKYFDNNAFLNLEKKYKVTYLLNKDKYKVSPPKNKKIIYYKTSKFSDVQYMSFIHLSMIKMSLQSLLQKLIMHLLTKEIRTVKSY